MRMHVCVCEYVIGVYMHVHVYISLCTCMCVHATHFGFPAEASAVEGSTAYPIM